MVEVAGRVGGRDMGQQPAAELAAAPRKRDAPTHGALRGCPREGDRGNGPEALLASRAAEAAHPSAGISAARFPADDVEAPAADRIDTLVVTLQQPEAGVARAARVDERRADPLVGLAGQVADHREADRAALGAIPVERHSDPGALQTLIRRITRRPRNRRTDLARRARGSRLPGNRDA